MRLRTWKYERRLRKLEKEMRRVQAEARKKKDEQLVDEWYAEHQWEFQLNNCAIDSIRSEGLVKQAKKFYLTLPDESDGNFWEHDMATQSIVLTSKAMNEVGAAIRKARRESIERW